MKWFVWRGERSAEHDNILFITGEVSEIPWEANFFTHAISVESAYYWPDPAAGVKEIHRVLRPGGQGVDSDQLLPRQSVLPPVGSVAGGTNAFAVRRRSGRELFSAAGFAQVSHERVVDPSPSPETYTGRWFRDAAELRAFKAEGALLIEGTK